MHFGLIMSLAKYSNRIVSFVHQNWQASALVAVLLLIGFVLKQPADSDKGTGQVGQADPENRRSELRHDLDSDLRRNDLQSAIAWQESDITSQAGAELVPVGFNAQERDPFELDREQDSPPILFEENSETADSTGTESADQTLIASDSKLLLMSTFLSDTRRAAYINQQLYFEGMQIRDGSNWWQVQRIEPRQVILAHGEDRHTLKIKASSVSVPAEAVDERISSDPNREESIR